MTQAKQAMPINRKVYALPYIPRVAPRENDAPLLRRVAGYARVSTNEEEQQNSYEAQIAYYTDYIQSHKGWTFAGMYADEGITGTSTKHRKDFNRMIQDALDGKIDLIVTKSVSRFARNTVDSLTIVRKLKEKGVEVYFERENIFTLDSKGELLITILSSLAQEEARSISENVTWGLRRRFAEGMVILPYKQFLGYERGEDGAPKVVEKEAQLVRRIYTLFLDGMTPSGIAKLLTKERVPTPAGKEKWQPGTVKSILTNEKYRGSALLQKTYTVDFLTKEKRVNEGEVQQYYVEESHPAIISAEVFELVQHEMKNRETETRHRSNVNCFSNRLVCAQCGSYYGRKVWHSTSKYRRFIWQCGHKFKNGEKRAETTCTEAKCAEPGQADQRHQPMPGYTGERCATPHLYEDDVKSAFVTIMNRLLQNRDAILLALEEAVSILADTGDYDRRLTRAAKKEEAIALKMRHEIERNARALLDQDEYNRRYTELAAQFDEAHAEVARLTEQKAKRHGRVMKLTSYLDLLRARDSLLTAFDEGLWSAVVQTVTVHVNGDMTFLLRDGSEQEYVKGS